LEETTKKGDQIFRSCWALLDRKGCRICPQGCDYTQHYHDKATIIVTEASRIEIMEEIKSKYDQATKNKNATLNKINTVADTKNLLEKALSQQIEDIKEECKKLKAICSNFDLSSELLIMINQIKAESLRLHSLEAKQQANDMIDSLTNFYNRIHEEYTTTRNKPEMKVIDTYIPPPAIILPKNIYVPPQPPQIIRRMSEIQISVRNRDMLAF
jgi:seryl-tRNA synthetase